MHTDTNCTKSSSENVVLFSIVLSEKGPIANDYGRGKCDFSFLFFFSSIHEALGNVCRHSGASEPRANTSAKR